MSNYFIQMSGVPGSGKSTVARGIATHINAIILDHDDTKSAIMATGIESDLAGQASYSVIKVLADKFLAGGNSIIVDSPCLYPELLEYGQSTAARHRAAYRYIECRLDKLETLGNRLLNRESKMSQVKSLDVTISHQGKPSQQAKALFREWVDSMKRPESGHAIIDTSESPEECIDAALKYVLFRT